MPVLKRKSTHLRYCTIQHKTDVNGLMLCYYIVTDQFLLAIVKRYLTAATKFVTDRRRRCSASMCICEPATG